VIPPGMAFGWPPVRLLITPARCSVHGPYVHERDTGCPLRTHFLRPWCSRLSFSREPRVWRGTRHGPCTSPVRVAVAPSKCPSLRSSSRRTPQLVAMWRARIVLKARSCHPSPTDLADGDWISRQTIRWRLDWATVPANRACRLWVCIVLAAPRPVAPYNGRLGTIQATAVWKAASTQGTPTHGL
jgi:hypothetical protein